MLLSRKVSGHNTTETTMRSKTSQREDKNHQQRHNQMIRISTLYADQHTLHLDNFSTVDWETTIRYNYTHITTEQSQRQLRSKIRTLDRGLHRLTHF